MKLIRRPRRNRKSNAIRQMLSESHLLAEHLVYPLFILPGNQLDQPIKSLPGISRKSLDGVFRDIDIAFSLGVKAFALFPVIDDALKNSTAQEALNENGLAPMSIREIKKRFPESILFADVALDPYNSDGHDGLVKDGIILNDETVHLLCQQALMLARAGADFVAPSDMMDGRIQQIRSTLDENNLIETSIMSYAAKYASAFYGPFRDALTSAPRFGDKKTYQMDPANIREALLEVEMDIAEGADIVMVKPALSYLDIIAAVAQSSMVPVAAYNVSGEYAMIKFASQAGAIDGERCMQESLLSIRRAGADLIFSYFALEMAKLLKR